MSRTKKITLSAPAPILTGSVSTVFAPCGKENCCCHRDESKYHGPYYRWTGSIDGRRTTIALSKQTAKECEARIKNYKLLLQQLDKIVVNALAHAPWKEKKPK